MTDDAPEQATPPNRYRAVTVTERAPERVLHSQPRHIALQAIRDGKDPYEVLAPWSTGTGTGAMNKLVQSGLVKVTETVTYDITPAGQRLLDAWDAEADYLGMVAPPTTIGEEAR